MRPSYQSFRSAFQHGVAAAAGRAAAARSATASRAATKNVLATEVIRLGRRAGAYGCSRCCQTTLRPRCKAFVSPPNNTLAADGSFARDAGDQGTAPRCLAHPRRRRALPRRRPRLRIAALARRRRPARPARRALAPRRALGLAAAAAAGAARRVARALDHLVGPAGPLLGVREPHARLPAL